MDSIRKNLEILQKKIERTCLKIGKKPSDITLVVVTKGQPVEKIKEAFEIGARIFGENKVQEATGKLKIGELHMIGRLQTNKTEDAVRFFDMIQSVDSIRLLGKVYAEAERQKKQIRALIQINVSKDPKKFGIFPEDALSFFRQVNPLLFSPYLRIEGLMTIVEHTGDIENRRPFFSTIKKIFDDLALCFEKGHTENVEMKYLSMGMTEDFEIAIEEGANMIRVGRGVFGTHRKAKRFQCA